MNNKLTLKLKADVIARAKAYASDKNVSLSRLIENYLDSITRKEDDEFHISPFVRSISTGKSIPHHVNAREERLDYLEKKHK